MIVTFLIQYFSRVKSNLNASTYKLINPQFLMGYSYGYVICIMYIM